MRRKNRRKLWMGAVLLLAFALMTVLVSMVDVHPVGPQGSSVGFAGMNSFVHQLTDTHMVLYMLTDWLSIVPFAMIGGFALLGLRQWIQRKSILKIDRSILALGVLYLIVMACYACFEKFVVNTRPVLIEGVLEASYPSSTTVLVMSVMPTSAMQFRVRIKSKALSRWTNTAITVFTALMVIGRLISGVHWFTDIIGGALLSSGLVMMYDAIGCFNESE